MQWLTTDPKVSTASSGKPGRRRIDGGVAGGRSLKTTTMQSLPGVWSGFFRWIGKDRRCRAQGHGSGVAVAASACGGALRCVRASQERARERRGEAQERGSEARGELGASGEARSKRGEGRQAAAVACMRAACGDHAPCPSSARRGTTGAGQSAGPACWAGPGRTVPGRR